jgi:hypothetical protein
MRSESYPVLVPVSRGYPRLTGRLPTCYSPVRRSIRLLPPEGFRKLLSLDLHVLGVPPAFVLSQDQTLHKNEDYLISSSGWFHSLQNDRVLHYNVLCSVLKVQLMYRNYVYTVCSALEKSADIDYPLFLRALTIVARRL